MTAFRTPVSNIPCGRYVAIPAQLISDHVILFRVVIAKFNASKGLMAKTDGAIRKKGDGL